MSATTLAADAPCPLCGALSSHPVHRVRGFTYVQCDECGGERLDPLPAPDVHDALFDPRYFEDGMPGAYVDYLADERIHRRNARSRLAAIARARGPGPGALLDVGCAAGYFLDEARLAGWTVAGVDVSEYARSSAAGNPGLALYPDLASALAAGAGCHDAVTFYQVLEEMVDPLAALEHARRLLRPGGLLVIETWDRSSVIARVAGSSWQQVNPPSVTYLFNRQCLSRLLARAGFGAVRIRRTGKRVRLGFALRLLAERMPRTFGPLARLGARTRIDRAGVPYRLGDLITVVARSPPLESRDTQ